MTGPRHGWTAGQCVRSVVAGNEAVIAALPYVLVSAIDSQRPDGAMSWVRERRAADPGWVVSWEPLVIAGERLVELVRAGLLNGFDEVWVLPRLHRTTRRTA